MKLPTTIKTISLIIGISLSVFAINLVVFAFTGPSQDPPGCPTGEPGCDAPLHVGIAGQVKDGPLGIEGAFRAYSNLIVDGNVGIGTASPSHKLDVIGRIRATNGFITTTKNDAGEIASGSGFFQTSAPVNYYSGASNWQHLIESRHSNDSNNYALQIAGGFFDQDLYFRKTNNSPTTAWSRFIYENSSGNVGIGTTSPGAKLDVRGQVIGGFGAQTTAGVQDWNDISNARSGSGHTLLLGSHANGPGGSYYHPFSFEYSSKTGTGNMTQFAIPYHSTGQNAGIYFRTRYSNTWQNWSKILSENTSGNVGIGTTSPTQKLDVRGNIYTTGDISAPSNSWGTCTYSSWSCSNELECAAGTFMARIGRNASGVAPQCGSGSNLYYQMRIMCCQL